MKYSFEKIETPFNCMELIEQEFEKLGMFKLDMNNLTLAKIKEYFYKLMEIVPQKAIDHYVEKYFIEAIQTMEKKEALISTFHKCDQKFLPL